jgi:pimeloyl-ACP methyl ester carboxylesterase
MSFTWRRTRTPFLVALLAAVLLNALAYLQVHRMTHFASGGARTKGPEEITGISRALILVTGVTVPRPRDDVTPSAAGLLFRTERIPLGREDSLEAWTIPADEPRGTVVLFHGYAASKSSLLNEARAFHEMGWKTVLVDFRGSGGSSGNDTTIGIREAEDVEAAARFARESGNGPLVLYGKSLGAVSILRAVAVRNVSASALVLESPFNRLVDTVGNRFRSMGIPAFPLAHLLVFWGSLQSGSSGFRHNPENYARSVRCPVLLFSGGRDKRVTREQAESLFSSLGGLKEFAFFEDAGHLSFLAQYPMEWRDRVRHLLLGASGAAGGPAASR